MWLGQGVQVLEGVCVGRGAVIGAGTVVSKDIPAYGVAVGVYDPVSLERLPVLDGDGQLQPDGRLILPGETLKVIRAPDP